MADYMSPVDMAGSVFQEKLQHELACTDPVDNELSCIQEVDFSCA